MHLKHTVYSYACNIKCINEEAENGVEEDNVNLKINSLVEISLFKTHKRHIAAPMKYLKRSHSSKVSD